jgi:hypothetical protein
MSRVLTLCDRMPECGDRLRLPGSDCIITIAFVPVTIEGQYPGKHTIKMDPEAWNAAIGDRKIYPGQLEYVSRADQGPVEVEEDAHA